MLIMLLTKVYFKGIVIKWPLFFPGAKELRNPCPPKPGESLHPVACQMPQQPPQPSMFCNKTYTHSITLAKWITLANTFLHRSYAVRTQSTYVPHNLVYGDLQNLWMCLAQWAWTKCFAIKKNPLCFTTKIYYIITGIAKGLNGVQ